MTNYHTPIYLIRDGIERPALMAGEWSRQNPNQSRFIVLSFDEYGNAVFDIVPVRSIRPAVFQLEG